MRAKLYRVGVAAMSLASVWAVVGAPLRNVEILGINFTIWVP